MEEKLKNGLPSQSMIVFAFVWFGVIGYAALNAAPHHALPQNVENTARNITDVTTSPRNQLSKTTETRATHSDEQITEISSVSRGGPDTPGTVAAPWYWDQHNKAHLE